MDITINGQSYTDDREAKKALAAANREAKKREAERNRKSAEAFDLALRAEHKVLALIDYAITYNEPLRTKSVQAEYDGHISAWRFPVESENGSGVQTFGYKPKRRIEANNGYDLAVFVQDDKTGLTEWYAVGAFEDVTSCVRLPNFIAKQIAALIK